VPVPASPPYLRPTRLEEALDALADGSRLVVAGGTDVYPAYATRPFDRPFVDVTAVAGLRGIERTAAGGWRLGGATTWTDVAERADLPGAFDGLRAAARTIGGRQIQNTGTLAGNLVNASPAADGLPNLLALDAAVELTSAARGARLVPLASFGTGYRATARAADELLTAIVVPPVDAEARGVFLKLGSRAYLVISIVSVAVVATVTDGRLSGVGIAVGACSPVPVRLRGLETALSGAEAAAVARIVQADPLDGLEPIDDVRATAAYRRDAARTLIGRAIAAAVAPR
jgi:CO/xanthine dehydrogenase FAD-binding subunit